MGIFRQPVNIKPVNLSTCAKALLIDPNRQEQTPYTMLIPVRSHGDTQMLKAQDLI